MKRIIEILNKTQFGSLATVEGNQARVRPFQFQFEEKGNFYFCSSANKEVVKQLRENSVIEYTTFDKSFTLVRIRGKVFFSDSQQLRVKLFKINPYYKEKFGHADNPELLMFYLKHGVAHIGHFDSYPPERIIF